MRTKLTPAFCQKATVQDGAERTIYWDEDMSGFGLLVTKNGRRSFVVQYRAGDTKKSRRMKIAGVLGLVGARKRAKKLLGQVADDKDPLLDRREQQRKAIARTEHTFEKIAEDYLAREGKGLRTLGQRRRMLKPVYKRLGSTPIDDIRRGDIVSLLDKIEDESGPVMADRTLATVRRIMNWHASRSDEFRTPIVRGMARTKGKERARARILSDDELRAIWKASDATPGPFGAFVQFLLLTAARRGEAAGMSRAELSGQDWTLPEARNKVKVDLICPLSPAAQERIAKLPRIGKAGYVFTTTGAQRPRRVFQVQAQAGHAERRERMDHPRPSPDRALAHEPRRDLERPRRALPWACDWRRARRVRSPRIPRREETRVRGVGRPDRSHC